MVVVVAVVIVVVVVVVVVLAQKLEKEIADKNCLWFDAIPIVDEVDMYLICLDIICSDIIYA